MDRSTSNVRSSINFLMNNDQEQREKIEIQLIPALQSFQTFIKMSNESQMAQIVDSLMTIEFFKKSCPEGSSLRDFIIYAGKALTYEYYKKGQIIFHYGDYGDKFFMILKGNVGVLVFFKYYQKHYIVNTIKNLSQLISLFSIFILNILSKLKLIVIKIYLINSLIYTIFLCDNNQYYIDQLLYLRIRNKSYQFFISIIPKVNHDIEIDRDFLVESNTTEPWSTVWKGRKLQSTIDMELLLAQGEDPWLISNRYFEGGVCLYQKIYSYYGGQTFGDVQLDMKQFISFQNGELDIRFIIQYI